MHLKCRVYAWLEHVLMCHVVDPTSPVVTHWDLVVDWLDVRICAPCDEQYFGT